MAILPSGLWDCCTSGAHGKTQRRFQPCKKKKTHHKPKGAVVRLSFSHAEPIWNPCISYYSKTFSKSQHIALFFDWMLKIFWLLPIRARPDPVSVKNLQLFPNGHESTKMKEKSPARLVDVYCVQGQLLPIFTDCAILIPKSFCEGENRCCAVRSWRTAPESWNI